MICGRCGSEAPDGARFCPACGNDLAAGTGQEERKLVSILFVDMVGSTARADGADPEDVRDRNQLYFNDARKRIEHYGGIVEKYIGDAVMAVFGTPLAKADDAERAVRAALSIIEGDPRAEPRATRPRSRAPGRGVHRGGRRRDRRGTRRAARDRRCRQHRRASAERGPPRRRADRASDLRAGPPLLRAHGARADPSEGQARAGPSLARARSAGRTGAPPRIRHPVSSVATTSSRSSPASGSEPSTRPGRTS